MVLFVTEASFKRSLEDMGELNVTDARRDLIFLNSYIKEHWPKVLALAWAMSSMRVSAEEGSCLEGVYPSVTVRGIG